MKSLIGNTKHTWKLYLQNMIFFNYLKFKMRISYEKKYDLHMYILLILKK